MDTITYNAPQLQQMPKDAPAVTIYYKRNSITLNVLASLLIEKGEIYAVFEQNKKNTRQWFLGFSTENGFKLTKKSSAMSIGSSAVCKAMRDAFKPKHTYIRLYLSADRIPINGLMCYELLTEPQL